MTHNNGKNVDQKHQAVSKSNMITDFFGQLTDKIKPYAIIIKEHTLDFFSALGENTVKNLSRTRRASVAVYKALFKKHERRISINVHRTARRCRYFLRKARHIAVHPFVKVFHGFKVLQSALQETKGLPLSRRLSWGTHKFADGMKNNKNVFKTIVNYGLPVLGIGLFLFVVNFAGSITFAVSVSYNDQNLGYVKDESIVNVATQLVQGRMVYLNESEKIEIVPTFSVEMTRDADVLDEYQLADEIISLSAADMVEAEGLYIDGQFLGALKKEGVIQQTLDELIANYKTGTEGEEVSFVNQVKVVNGLYLTGNIKSEEEIITMLKSNKQAEVYYTVIPGDAPTLVADKNDVPYSTLKALNPDIENLQDFKPGLQVLISNSEPFLPVQVKRTITYTEEIPFNTQVNEDANLTKGTQQTVQEGENGQNTITANVTYINNMEASREILNAQTTKEPVTKVVSKGTKTLAPKSSTGSGSLPLSDNTERSSSGFIWPMKGYVSSEYAPRWGSFHGGIDIARAGGATGAPIYASASGRVIFASYSGDYGKLVKIDHGNGLQTWYAHNSVLNVSVGQNVSQGQQIAAAGSSGNVTGPHCHFEVRVNGMRQNPRKYLP